MEALRKKFKKKESEEKEQENIQEVLETAQVMLNAEEEGDVDFSENNQDNTQFDNKTISRFKKGTLTELEDLVKNVNFGREDYKIPSNMKFLKESDFPLFCTLKEFYIMLNNGITHNTSDIPFFNLPKFKTKEIEILNHKLLYRNYKVTKKKAKKFAKQYNKKAEEEKKKLNREYTGEEFAVNFSRFLDEYTVSRFKDELEFDKIHMNYKESKKRESLENEFFFSRMITFEIFQRDFYDSNYDIKISKKFPASLIWSYLKNSKFNYSNRLYQIEEFNTITLLEKYKKFKRENHYYDLNDLFEHTKNLLDKVKYTNWLEHKEKYGTQNKIQNAKRKFFLFSKKFWYEQIDYLFVDEIQDISYDILLHLCTLTRRNLMLFGDNAQNIAKGISLKFNYFATQLTDNKLDNIYLQLTKNFRSHQSILNLGNSIVKILTLFSRGDLEVMPDEKSDREGPKPVFLKIHSGRKLIKEVLEKSLGATKDEKTGHLKFKNEFVVLVRNQETKKKLPEFLSNAVCMTIKESKGLEFEDVLIFNFFDSTNATNAYNILEHIEIMERKVKNSELEELFEKIKGGNIDTDRVYVKYRKSDEEGYSIMTEIVLSQNISKGNLGLYDEINDELKQFYVAVTRTKNRLVVVDWLKEVRFSENNHPRRKVERIWKEFGFIEVIDKQVSEWRVEDSKWAKLEMVEGGDEIVEQKGDIFSQMIEYNKDETETEFREKWLKKAVEFFRQGKLEFSRLCFSSISHELGIQFVEACEIIGNIQRRKEFILQNLTKMPEIDIERQEDLIKIDFIKAAEIFENQNRSSLAAKCYSSVGDYKKALELALKSEDDEMKADLYFINKEYQEAFKYYENSKNMDMQIRTLNEMCKIDPDYYEKLLNLMYEHVQDMTEKKHESFKPFFKSVIRNYFSYLDMTMKEKELEKLKQEIQEKKNEEKEEIEENLEGVKKENEEEKEEDDFDTSSFKNIQSLESSSFKMVETSDQASASDNSFLMVKSDLNEEDRISESFVNKGSLVKGNTETNSIFEEVDTFDPDSFNFLESSTIAKMIKYTSCFFDRIKGYLHTNKLKSGLEITESDEMLLIQDKELIKILLEILADLNLTNLLSLIFNKYKVKYPIESSLINMVKEYSMVWKFKADYRNQFLYNKRKIANSLTQRKISAMVIKSTFNKLKIGATNKEIGMSSLMALGFIRQIPALTSFSTAKKIFSILGNTEFLFPLIGYNKFKGKELDAFLIKNNRSGLIDKLLLTFDTLEEDIEALDGVLYKYSVYELWEKIDKESRNRMNETLDKISIHNKLIARTLKAADMMKYYDKLSREEKDELCDVFPKILNKINNVLVGLDKASESDILIAGYSLAIMSRFLFYTSYTLNTQDNYSFIKKFYEKNKKPIINFLFSENPRLFKQISKIYTSLKNVDFSTKSTIMKKHHYLFIRGYFTAYLARILDPSVKELRFYSNKRVFLNKFSTLTTKIEDEIFAVENGGEFLLYSFNNLIKEISSLRNMILQKVIKWSNKSILTQNHSNVSGLLSLCKIKDVTDDHARSLQDFKRAFVSARSKIKPVANAISIEEEEEANMLNRNREKMIRKLRKIKLENYLPISDEKISNLLISFENGKEVASENPYFETKDLDLKREGILNIFLYIEKFLGFVGIQSIYEYFCLSLNLGNLGYFLKFRRLVNKKTNKFKTSLFYLIDSEISLQSGNTEEFYNEILEFILNQFSNLTLESIAHLFYKVIMVVSLQKAAYSDHQEVAMIEGDYNKLSSGYPKCRIEDLQLNIIEKDPEYTLLREVYDMIFEKFDNGYFPQIENIINKIEFLIEENGLFDIGEDLEFKFQNVLRAKVNTKNYSLDENYVEYSLLLNQTQKQRAELEFVNQAIRKFLNTREPKVTENTQENTKESKFRENLALIDYDYILWMDALNNPETLKLFQEDSFCKMFKFRLQPFVAEIYEEFYIKKKKVIEKFLPFVINFNNDLMDLITSDFENIDLKILNIYKFISVKKHALETIMHQKYEVKIFKNEDEFFESQKILMKKMLLGYKVSQDLNKTKSLIKKEKERREKEKKKHSSK